MKYTTTPGRPYARPGTNLSVIAKENLAMGFLGRLFGSTYETVDVARARELLDSGAVLVDVRTTQEYRTGHAPAARHIPWTPSPPGSPSCPRTGRS